MSTGTDKQADPLNTNHTKTPILAAIHAAQHRHALFTHLPPQPHRAPPRPQTVVIGVSGGADSVCLLHALYALRQTWRLAIHVAHLDHNLRPTSADDADWVRELAAARNLPYHHARLEPGALDHHPGGPEDAARRARYTFLCQTARAVTPPEQMPVIAVAHHLDDQAETVLMNLIRGSGPLGLAGMAPVTTIHHPPHTPPVRLIRPLLNVSRADIHADLRRAGHTWCEDASNTDARYLRNRIRHTILPTLAAINPQIHGTLARNADILAGDAARLAAQDRQTLATILTQSTPAAPVEELQAAATTQRLILDLDRFQRLDWPTRRGVLRQALACFPIEPRAMGYREIDTLLDALAAAHTSPTPPPGPHPLPGGLAWTFFPASPLSAFSLSAHSVSPTVEHPTRCSLHRTGVLPWQPDHPYLDPHPASPAVPLPIPGVVTFSTGWRLHARLLAPDQLPVDWRAHLSPWEAYMDAEQVDAEHVNVDPAREPAPKLVVTTPQAGMRIAPLGMAGHTKTLGDLFTDAKIHPTLRPVWPIIQNPIPSNLHNNMPDNFQEDIHKVTWACGLALSHWARLTAETRRILHLAWHPHAR